MHAWDIFGYFDWLFFIIGIITFGVGDQIA